MGQRMTAAQVRDALAGRWPPEQYVVIPEAPNTATRQGRKIDLLVISCWKSRGYELDAVEVKISMSDWKRELEGYTDPVGRFHGGPDKADWWWAHSHRFWIAAPADIAAKIKPQLPGPWGLIACSAGKTRVLVDAPRNPEPEPLEWPVVVGLLRTANGAGVNALQRRYADGFKEGREQGRQRAMQEGAADSEEVRELREQVRRIDQVDRVVTAFKEATGIDISDRWDARVERTATLFGLVEKAVRLGPDVIDTRLRHQVDQIRSAATDLDRIRKALSEVTPAEVPEP